MATLMVAVGALAGSSSAHAAYGNLATNYSDNYKYIGQAYVSTGTTTTMWKWTATGWKQTSIAPGTRLYAYPFAPGSWHWVWTSGAWHAIASNSISVVAGSLNYTPWEGKWRIERTYADDPARASAFLATARTSVANIHTRAAAEALGYRIGVNSAAALAAGKTRSIHMWKRAYRLDNQAIASQPDGLMLYLNTDGSATVIGAIYQTSILNPDLGLGTWHVHHSTDNEARMKHVWFNTTNLNTAMSDEHPPGLDHSHE